MTDSVSVIVPAFSLKITIDDAGVHIGTESGAPMPRAQAQAILEQFISAPWRSVQVLPDAKHPGDNHTLPPEFERRLPK